MRQKFNRICCCFFFINAKKVIKEKNELYEKNLKEGIVLTPSLSEVIADDYVEKVPTKRVEGLRDDLDDIDENDVGKVAFHFYILRV